MFILKNVHYGPYIEEIESVHLNLGKCKKPQEYAQTQDAEESMRARVINGSFLVTCIVPGIALSWINPKLISLALC